MKSILRTALLAALLPCLLCAPARSQALKRTSLPPAPVAPLPLLAPRLVLPGTTLADSSVVFAPATYEALRRDYAWQAEAIALKQHRLEAAATIDTTTTRLLIQSQLETSVARTAASASAKQAAVWQNKYIVARALQRPPALLDKRLYLGGGIGLGLGVLGTCWLLWHFR